ncbi:MAG TPA: ABC transporter permease [Candidatus Limnocylindrales bacterium]|nr:ABC transporter permease [Candidatus Limnocylindrales bacterium]
MRSLLSLLWTVSRRELIARPVRVALVVGSVATGVALLTAMRVATDSIVAGYMADLARMAGKAQLQITIGTGEAGFSEDVLETVRRVPEVRQAAGMVRGAVAFADAPEQTLELFGIDVMQKDVLDLYGVETLARTADDFAILNDPRAVFLPEPVARERGLSLESRVVLSGVDGTHEYTVRGIFAPKGLPEAFGGQVVAMYLPAAQPVAGRRGDLTASQIDQIDVRVADGVTLDAAKAALERALPPELVVAEPAQRRLLGAQVVDGLRATLVGMSTLALLASIFIVYASATTLVRQRTPNMATLMTLGAKAGDLVRTMIAEAAILGAAGSFVGVGIGLLLANFVAGDVAAGMSLNYAIAFDSPILSIDPLILLIVHPLGGTLTAAASAFLPARALARLDPLVLQRGTEKTVSSARLPLQPILLIGVSSTALGAAAIGHGVATVSALWCTLGGVATVLGSVLALAPLLPWLWSSLYAPLTRMGGITGQLAAENLRRSSDRSLVTACAVALSIAVAIGASSLVVSFRSSVASWYGFAGDALVSARASGGGWLPAPVSGDIEASLAALPSVSGVEVLRVAQGQLFRGQRIAVAALSPGMLLSAVRQSAQQPEDVAGAVAAINAGTAAAVSENFVRHFGVDAGDAIEVATPGGALALPVVAVVSDYTSDKGSVIVARRLYRDRWNDSLVNYYSVELAPGATMSDLRSDVGRSAGATHALSILATREMVARVDGLIGQAFADIDTIKLLVVFLAVAGIGDLMASYVLDRRRELALLRLAGALDSTIMRTMATEAVCIGVAAALLGTAIGAVSAWVWVSFNYPILVGYVLVPRFAWDSAAICLALSVAAAAVAGVGAARVALLQPALEGVRYE